MHINTCTQQLRSHSSPHPCQVLKYMHKHYTHTYIDTVAVAHLYTRSQTRSREHAHSAPPTHLTWSVHMCILILRHTRGVSATPLLLQGTPPQDFLGFFCKTPNLAFLDPPEGTLKSSPPRRLGTEGSSTAGHSQVTPSPLTHVKTTAKSDLQAPHPFF